MLSCKSLVFIVYLTVLGVDVATFDDLNNGDVVTESVVMQDQNQKSQNMPINEGNFIANFVMKYSYPWATYLTELSSSFGEVVSDTMFHLLDTFSSFPLTLLETFCVASICLLFLAVTVIMNRLGGQNNRVAALEEENTSLRESNKMNRIILNELQTENTQPVIDDLRDKIQAIEDRQNRYSEYRVTIDAALYNLKKETEKLCIQIRELQSKYMESMSSANAIVDPPNNHDSSMSTQNYTNWVKNCQQPAAAIVEPCQYNNYLNQVDIEPDLNHNSAYQVRQAASGPDDQFIENRVCTVLTTDKDTHEDATCHSRADPKEPCQSLSSQEAVHKHIDEAKDSCQFQNCQEVTYRPNNGMKKSRSRRRSNHGSVQMNNNAIESHCNQDTPQPTNLQSSFASEEIQSQYSKERNSHPVTGKSEENNHSDQRLVSYDELIWYINELVYSCNDSYLKVQTLQRSQKDMFRFVDVHFGKIFQELGYLSAWQRKQTDTDVTRRESYL